MTYDDGIAHVAGWYVPIAEAAVPVLDLGFLHSDATYDVAHVGKGRFFRLGDQPVQGPEPAGLLSRVEPSSPSVRK